MKERTNISRATLLLMVSVFVCSSATASAQQKGDGSLRTVLSSGAREEQGAFAPIYRDFYERYKLGPDDELSIYVTDQPDYTIEHAPVSAGGRIFHPLTGEIEVGGLTVAEVEAKLTRELREYIRNPRVSVTLRAAKSAKVGVLGEVHRPGIVVLARPMRLLDVIAESGGFTDFGKASHVIVLRQDAAGQMRTIDVNVKRILQGKAAPGDNVEVLAGDTVVVNGNAKKSIAFITSLTGFGGFRSFVGR